MSWIGGGAIETEARTIYPDKGQVVRLMMQTEPHLALLCLSYRIQCQEAAVTVFTVSAVVAVSVVTATPLKLNTPFPTSSLQLQDRAFLEY